MFIIANWLETADFMKCKKKKGNQRYLCKYIELFFIIKCDSAELLGN